MRTEYDNDDHVSDQEPPLIIDRATGALKVDVGAAIDVSGAVINAVLGTAEGHWKKHSVTTGAVDVALSVGIGGASVAQGAFVFNTHPTANLLIAPENTSGVYQTIFPGNGWQIPSVSLVSFDLDDWFVRAEDGSTAIVVGIFYQQ